MGSYHFSAQYQQQSIPESGNLVQWDWFNTYSSELEREPEDQIVQSWDTAAKNVFQLHGVDRNGKAVWKRQLSRDKWLKVLCTTVPTGAEIGMEACAGAQHHWSRILIDRGYKVKIIPAQFVKPFLKSNKNDVNDAEAICEAMARPNMHPVSVKSIEQQDPQVIHRVREEIKGHRTAKGNQIHGLVSEYGLVAPKELAALRKAISYWMEDATNSLTMTFRQLLQGLWEDLRLLDKRMAELDR